MRILITNDDGMGAQQLVELIRYCRKYGQVTTVVPKYEQSGKSHGIEIHRPFEAKQVELAPGITAWAVDSTPADCVRFAILGKGMEFDLVISGINRGLNIGADIMYSGTVSAACEAANLGVKAIALSTPPENYHLATRELDRIASFVREKKLLALSDLYNINIPADPKGIKITRQGGPYYSDDFAPEENDMYRPCGKPVWVDRSDYTLDTDATLNGYITVTPLTINRTDLRVFEMLTK
ncbi:MAG: 5'/3'-nucleotidase SurE [Oscillospiraceae bacterium]|nr:5'/3'-nucleotidase SurE [Oscillospiraceae bacterium]